METAPFLDHTTGEWRYFGVCPCYTCSPPVYYPYDFEILCRHERFDGYVPAVPPYYLVVPYPELPAWLWQDEDTSGFAPAKPPVYLIPSLRGMPHRDLVAIAMQVVDCALNNQRAVTLEDLSDYEKSYECSWIWTGYRSGSGVARMVVDSDRLRFYHRDDYERHTGGTLFSHSVKDFKRRQLNPQRNHPASRRNALVETFELLVADFNEKYKPPDDYSVANWESQPLPITGIGVIVAELSYHSAAALDRLLRHSQTVVDFVGAAELYSVLQVLYVPRRGERHDLWLHTAWSDADDWGRCEEHPNITLSQLRLEGFSSRSFEQILADAGTQQVGLVVMSLENSMGFSVLKKKYLRPYSLVLCRIDNYDDSADVTIRFLFDGFENVALHRSRYIERTGATVWLLACGYNAENCGMPDLTVQRLGALAERVANMGSYHNKHAPPHSSGFYEHCDEIAGAMCRCYEQTTFDWSSVYSDDSPVMDIADW